MLPTTQTRTQVQHLDHLNLSVADLAATIDWYQRVFGFEVVERAILDDDTPFAVLRAGEALLCVYEHGTRRFVDNMSRRDQGIHGINHFSLRITDHAAWEETVRRERVRFSYGNGAIRYPHSTSWYVADPTGYQIEVVHWHEGRSQFAGA